MVTWVTLICLHLWKLSIKEAAMSNILSKKKQTFVLLELYDRHLQFTLVPFTKHNIVINL